MDPGGVKQDPDPDQSFKKTPDPGRVDLDPTIVNEKKEEKKMIRNPGLRPKTPGSNRIRNPGVHHLWGLFFVYCPVSIP